MGRKLLAEKDLRIVVSHSQGSIDHPDIYPQQVSLLAIDLEVASRPASVGNAGVGLVDPP